MVTSTPLTTTCTSCASSFFLENGQCSTTCSAGTWNNQITLVCQACPTSCATCQSDTKCQTCKEGFHLNENHLCESCVKPYCRDCTLNGQAVAQCQLCNDGYYVTSSGDCTVCSDGCRRCDSAELCVECEDGYMREVSSNGASATCSQCSVDHCDTCSTPSTCS